MIDRITTAVGPEEFIVAALFSIVGVLWLAWAPANKSRRQDAHAIILYAMTMALAAIRWILSIGAAPILGVTAKELRRMRAHR